jgi:hypothetical protein
VGADWPAFSASARTRAGGATRLPCEPFSASCATARGAAVAVDTPRSQRPYSSCLLPSPRFRAAAPSNRRRLAYDRFVAHGDCLVFRCNSTGSRSVARNEGDQCSYQFLWCKSEERTGGAGLLSLVPKPLVDCEAGSRVLQSPLRVNPLSFFSSFYGGLLTGT